MKCNQAGCTGTIEEGYCNICGAPAGAKPMVAATAPPGGSGGAGGAGSTKTSSNRLASRPIGSSLPSSTRTKRTGTGRRTVGRLGAGITTVPSSPVADPRTAVMAVPEVAESKRFCPACGAPVGRSRDGQPGRTEGFCPKCRTQYSFSPKLAPGDVVGGQYEVVGCLAHGGLGWIYLATDRNVSDRYVVLKGLLNSGDVDAYQSAIAERQFLAEVQHPLIVEIYNFVIHDGAGYTVMEYVGGKSLKTLLKDRMKANGGKYDPIPVDQAIAFIVEILPALGYLHGMNLLYCDFKPDNVIQEGDALKLIDLGGVRRADDMTSPIYGTVGFQAPEVADLGPSIPGDIFTVGRTLAVLIMEFRGYQSTYVDSFPPLEDTPLLQRHDSLHRLLVKACAPSPADRFQSAEEMREQLLGVLREVVAIDGRAALHSMPSALFEAPSVAGSTLDWQQLPTLKVDPADPMASWLAGVSVDDPAERVAALGKAPEQTIEVRLAIARAAIDFGMTDLATQTLGALLDENPWEWRAVWLAGLAELSAGNTGAAVASFNTVYGQVPGELAPKLALALACELNDDVEIAAALYTVCARSDAAYSAAAAFGLGRIRAASGDIGGALSALDLVAPTSRSFVDARRQRAELLVDNHRNLGDLSDAARSLDSVPLESRERLSLLVRIYQAALGQVIASGPNPGVRIGDVPAEQDALRRGAEDAYRHLAAVTDDRNERIRLVDAANRVRPRTLV
jgi:serine/threonine-protein kinase PknG